MVDAEKFWNHYNSIGWKVGKSTIRCWQSVCYVWDRGDKRQALKEAAQLPHIDEKMDERAEKRQAHIDEKMDERERKRERRTGGGRDMRRTLRAIDAPYWEHVRELRFCRALYRLRNHPELQKTLRAIRRHRVRRKFFSALKIEANVYRERLSRLTKILGIST